MTTSNPCWRHHDRDPLSKVDRIRKEGDNFVAVMRDGSISPLKMPNHMIQSSINEGKLVGCKDEPLSTTTDDEIVWSMVAFLEIHGGERMLRATEKACKLIAAKAESELDGTSRDVWKKAGELVGQAAAHLEEN